MKPNNVDRLLSPTVNEVYRGKNLEIITKP
jgi:hypothetical protein